MNRDPEVMQFFAALQSEESSNATIDAWKSQLARQGWSNWAVELAEAAEFIGFIGLTVPRRTLPFSPCVEIGWRISRPYWGMGYASEGARAALRAGFEGIGLSEIVSFTALTNVRSRALMERIGLRDTGQDFEHPGVPESNSLRMHCLYKITRAQWSKNVA